MKRTICLDIETTGLDRVVDEILQLSIIDESEEVLYNEYFAPEWRTEWPEAMKVNHITPHMLEGKPRFKDCLPAIQSIIDQADAFITYNGESFDIPMLEFKGIKFPDEYNSRDVKLLYGRYKGEWNHEKNSWKWWKLVDAAKHFNISFDVHNSLGDCIATLRVLKEIDRWETPLVASFWHDGDRVICPSYEKMVATIKRAREAGIIMKQRTEPFVLYVEKIKEE